MDYQDIMQQLKKMGTAQNVKVYKRHGAGENLFGVSFANLNKLKKQIKVNHPLAVELWNSGNVDAQSLATMVADPLQLTKTQANAWVKDIQYYLLADLLAGLVARSPHAAGLMEKWMASKKEHVRQCGYAALASFLKDNHEITDTTCRTYLKTIQKEIHQSPNRARHSMNGALIAIGVFRPSLAAEAISTARKIGPVDVDHGQTSCKTPDAIDYIQRSANRGRRAKASR